MNRNVGSPYDGPFGKVSNMVRISSTYFWTPSWCGINEIPKKEKKIESSVDYFLQGSCWE